MKAGIQENNGDMSIMPLPKQNFGKRSKPRKDKVGFNDTYSTLPGESFGVSDVAPGNTMHILPLDKVDNSGGSIDANKGPQSNLDGGGSLGVYDNGGFATESDGGYKSPFLKVGGLNQQIGMYPGTTKTEGVLTPAPVGGDAVPVAGPPLPDPYSSVRGFKEPLPPVGAPSQPVTDTSTDHFDKVADLYSQSFNTAGSPIPTSAGGQVLLYPLQQQGGASSSGQSSSISPTAILILGVLIIGGAFYFIYKRMKKS